MYICFLSWVLSFHYQPPYEPVTEIPTLYHRVTYVSYVREFGASHRCCHHLDLFAFLFSVLNHTSGKDCNSGSCPAKWPQICGLLLPHFNIITLRGLPKHLSLMSPLEIVLHVCEISWIAFIFGWCHRHSAVAMVQQNGHKCVNLNYHTIIPSRVGSSNTTFVKFVLILQNPVTDEHDIM